MSYDNTNSGMLARNDKKETEKHPDFKGSYKCRWGGLLAECLGARGQGGGQDGGQEVL
jgi:hypothetical protein